MSVTLQLKGNYPQVLSFIKELEALNRTVLISNMTLAANEGGMIEGSINLDFYALPKVQDQDRDKQYMSWPYSGIYGKTNPFAR